MAVVGIDPGTSTWGFARMDEGTIAQENAIATSEIKEDPGIALEATRGADLVVAPSGYGLPLKKVSDLNEKDFKEILLKKEGEDNIMGLEAVLQKFKENEIPAYVIPSVKHLPTVPSFKKRNKIDMGTPDKLCATACAIVDQSDRLGVSHSETNLILCEIGAAFNAFIAVRGGCIVDGIGGTLASSGLRSSGAIDGEIAYLMGGMSKSDLLGGDRGIDEHFLDGLLKDIARISITGEPKEIVLSGSRSGDVEKKLRGSLDLTVVKLNRAKGSSNAAVGAAMLADGLSGGRFKELVDGLRIGEASGSVLDDTVLESRY